MLPVIIKSMQSGKHINKRSTQNSKHIYWDKSNNHSFSNSRPCSSQLDEFLNHHNSSLQSLVTPHTEIIIIVGVCITHTTLIVIKNYLTTCSTTNNRAIRWELRYHPVWIKFSLFTCAIITGLCVILKHLSGNIIILSTPIIRIIIITTQEETPKVIIVS